MTSPTMFRRYDGATAAAAEPRHRNRKEGSPMLGTASHHTAAPAETVTTCNSCGVTLPPAGACLEIGRCHEADRAATRNATGATHKQAVPAAWNAAGTVD